VSKKEIFCFLICLLFASCGRNQGGKTDLPKTFPPETDINKLNSTEFALSLQCDAGEEKNMIYSPTLLFAWKEVRNLFDQPITLNGSFSEDLALINQDTLFKNSLEKNEYKTSVEKKDKAILVSAFFHQSLPFPAKFQVLHDSFSFNSKPVRAFGMEYYEEPLASQVKILYYKNDNYFAISLSTSLKGHELILCRGIPLNTSLEAAVRSADSLIHLGRSENYVFTEYDKLAVPVIKFNISKHYNTLEGQSFMSGEKSHIIAKAYQRTALTLDESGAEVQSEAQITADSAMAPDTTPPPSKHLYFDKPFLLMIRKANRNSPYFCALIKNAELMESPDNKPLK
jgi:hypothetical protein